MADAGVEPLTIAQAFIMACEDELRAPKPGNVHFFAPGHRMEARDFIESAYAASDPLAAPGASVGARILGAVEATWARVGQNTNLGIVLLCAPLAHSALHLLGSPVGERTLRAQLAKALMGLDQQDAALAFKAILRAQPAGLGEAPEHDVGAPAQTTLLEAMRTAADRDRIAFQYANDFVDIFETGFDALAASRAENLAKEVTTLRLYTAFVSAFPDSHIMRKYGAAAGAQVMEEARAFKTFLHGACDAKAAFSGALEWDKSLKERGFNPGTSADLTVATLFADYLSRILANARKNG